MLIHVVPVHLGWPGQTEELLTAPPVQLVLPATEWGGGGQ